MEVATLSFVRTPGHANDPQPTKTDNGRTAIVHVGELSCPARAEKNKSLASGYAADQIMASPPIGTDQGLSGGIFATTPRVCLGITTGWRRRFVRPTSSAREKDPF